MFSCVKEKLKRVNNVKITYPTIYLNCLLPLGLFLSFLPQNKLSTLGWISNDSLMFLADIPSVLLSFVFTDSQKFKSNVKINIPTNIK